MVVAGHCSKLVITAWDEDLKTLETLANLRFMVMRVVFFVFNTSHLTILTIKTEFLRRELLTPTAMASHFSQDFRRLIGGDFF